MKDKRINGNTVGISKAAQAALEELYETRMERDEFISPALLAVLAKHTTEMNREISVLVSRAGIIEDISIGEPDRVAMPEINKKRSEERLSGIRCIHTHPGGSGQLSNVDLGTLSEIRLDSMAAVGVRDGKATELYAAYLTNGQPAYMVIGPVAPQNAGAPQLMEAIYEADGKVGRGETLASDAEDERAILVGLKEDGMDELAELATTAGAEVVGMEVQARATPDNAYCIGSGKVSDLSLLRTDLNANLIILNNELTPVQQRNLENRLGVKIVDRTTLILDIFALRAKSREGRLQVELAQLKYLLPRLVGKGTELSRQGAGVGIASRGPGETKLEMDRRRIRGRISDLEKELQQVFRQREMRRNQRTQSQIPVIALVGYTNAGKSTLLNALSDADALAEDKLFATLDPLTRKAEIDGKEIMLTDTVGFVQDLPHDLVDAFHSTLEEVVDADLLLHVVDGSHPDMRKHIEVVNDVLASLGAGEKPTIRVFNKMDVAETDAPAGMVGISARTGQGIGRLKDAIIQNLGENWRKTEIKIPYSRSDLAASIRAKGKVMEEQYAEDEIIFQVELPIAELNRIKNEMQA